MTGTPDWSGTRLLHGTDQLLIIEHDNIAPGATVTDTVMVTRPGYILEIHAWNATDNTTLTAFNVFLRWEDAQSGDGLDSQLWQMFAGTAATPHYINGSGPTKGGTLKVEVTNPSFNTTNLSYFIIVDETSFAYQRHDWRTDDIFGFTIPGLNSPLVYDADAGLMGALNGFSLAANTTLHWALPLYNGPVQLHADTSGAAGSTEVWLTLRGPTAPSLLAYAFDQLVPTTGLDATFYLPRIQTVAAFQNHSAGAVTVDLAVMMGER